MHLSLDQVDALAPDAGAAAAGRKLADPKVWRHLGRSADALWGECQGSALYQVRVALSDLAAKCTCPSRKFPCKHSLGLLYLAAGQPARLPDSEPPPWLSEWLGKRAATSEKKAKRKARAAEPVDPAAQARRAERRQERVAQGLEALDLWLCDLVRGGLAVVESQGPQLWESQAARLVDAQAPAIATRLRGMAEVPRSTSDWPQRLLLQLGRLALLSHAFRRLDALAPALQHDVRQMVGWTMSQEDVVAAGDVVSDDWLVLGQWIDDDARLRVQRNWLQGATSGRAALVLQFSAAGAPFSETIVPGTRMSADLAFWPSASPQRALIRERRGNPTPWSAPLPGRATIEAFLGGVADQLARQPWLERFGCSLRDVVPIPPASTDEWLVVDTDGAALRLKGSDHWRLLAFSGGAPIDLAAEWDGEHLLPLGLVVEGRYEVLWTSQQ